MNRGIALSYDDISLIPKFSALDSRSDADTWVQFGRLQYKLPVIPSNMTSSIDEKLASWLSESAYFYVMHRFSGVTVPFVRKANKEEWNIISISTGVNDDSLAELKTLHNDRCVVDYITIDVAHGHHIKVKNRIAQVRELFPNAFIIAGNASSPEAVNFLDEAGADAIKCLIGTGSACSTRYKTGFQVPAFTCIYNCSFATQKPLIADGGAKHYGDIAKALVAGARMVMAGGMFASCSDSPAEEINGKKRYFGNASVVAKGENIHVEGFDLQLEKEDITIHERLIEMKQALQSSISYAGGKDLNCFKDVDFCVIQK